MQTVTLVSAFVLVAVALLTEPQTADAECCLGIKKIPLVCGDCTTGTPYCAHGKCNIFGCNCDGGCRNGRCNELGKRSVESEIGIPESIVTAGDVNGDGVLSFEEAESLLQQRMGPSEEHRRSVRSLDKNNDGHLSAHEIDF